MNDERRPPANWPPSDKIVTPMLGVPLRGPGGREPFAIRVETWWWASNREPIESTPRFFMIWDSGRILEIDAAEFASLMENPPRQWVSVTPDPPATSPAVPGEPHE